MKQSLRLLIGSLLGLCLLISGVGATEPAAASLHTFVDTSDQLGLDDILSNRYANLFVPNPEAPLKLPAEGAALWVEIPLPEPGAHLLELHNPTIARIHVYLLNDGQLRSSFEGGTAQPGTSISLSHNGFSFPITVGATAQQKLLVRLQNDYPINTDISLVPLTEAIHIHIRHQALQGILVGLLFGLALNCLVQGMIRRDSLHLLMALTSLLFALSSLSSISWVLSEWTLLHGRAGGLLLLGGFAALAATLQNLQPTFGLSGSGGERVIIMLAGILVLLLAAVQPALLQPISSAVRTGLPLLVMILLLVSLIRHRPIDLLFLIGTLLLAASGLAEQFGTLLPADLNRNLVDFLLWAALASYTWSLYRRLQRRLAKRDKQRYAETALQAQRSAKADFLTRISHEIRTPMSGVLGMSELLLDTALSAKQRDYVQTIQGSGNDLLNLINEILDISRLDSGQLMLENVVFDLHALVNDCLEIYRGRLDNQSVELISFVHPDVPRLMEGDPTRLRQVLVSLLNNAMLNTDEGEILLVVALERKADTAPLLRFAIQNTGHGMAPEARSSLLETHDRNTGLLDLIDAQSHLSLFICQQLVRMMLGQLGIKDTPAEGTTVWMTLPAQLIDSTTETDQEGRCLTDRSILIVDDNATCRKVLQQQTSAWHMLPRTASSGREALAMLRAQANLDAPFEIMLVDQYMPGMTGLELASRIKDDPTLSNDMLIIMLTGINQLPSRVVARNAGIHRILNKPVSGHTLRATLIDEWQQRVSHEPVVNQAEDTQAKGGEEESYHVLVAEDNAISTRVILGMLTKLKIVCHGVENGRKALEAVQSGQYDLVLMDCEMPEMDGFTAAEQIRAWEREHAADPVPIIALTAHTLPEHRERARLSGMNDHMAKPVELPQLKELLDHWRGRKSGDH